jgi:hypothetical protein
MQVAIVVGLFVFGLGVARVLDVEIAVSPSAKRMLGEASYVPSQRRESGPQLVMIYFGSSTCLSSNQPTLPGAVESLKLRLANYAARRGLSFKTVGVALDWSPAFGISHLEKFGLFDELSSGYSWGNTFALTHFFAATGATPATPQVIVLHRQFVAPNDSSVVVRYTEEDRRVLMAKAGVDAIVEWAASDIILDLP